MGNRLSLDKIYEKLNTAIRKKGLKKSQQRECILKILFQSEEHLSPEEILFKAKENCTGVSISSIYRILSFLEGEKLVNSIDIDSSGKKYEIATGIHHDHLICIECGKVIEFYSEELEKMQEKIALDLGAELIDHDLKLYAKCKECLHL